MFSEYLGDLLKLNPEQAAAMKRAAEAGMAFAALERITIDREALKCVPLELAWRFTVMPIKRFEDTLWLGMTLPVNRQAMEEVSVASGCRVVPVVVMGRALSDALETYYPMR